MMVHNEMRLFELIQGNDNPEQAVLLAINVFSAFLMQLEECPELPTVCPQEFS